jgi:hypothetical protein
MGERYPTRGDSPSGGAIQTAGGVDASGKDLQRECCEDRFRKPFAAAADEPGP